MIFGGGPYFENAREQAKNLDNIFIHELMPQDRISEVYSLGDIALITCKKGTGKIGMPSKTWSIMACNTPIIASFDEESDLSDVIYDSGAEKCVEPENINKLKEKMLKQFKCSAEVSNLRKYVKNNASREYCINRFRYFAENPKNEIPENSIINKLIPRNISIIIKKLWRNGQNKFIIVCRNLSEKRKLANSRPINKCTLSILTYVLACQIRGRLPAITLKR